jgi:polyphosphate kinase
VPIDLIVRGFCTIRPGVKGMSQRIRVRSIIGRFLEHSRVFYFRNGAADPVDGEFYIGSADWMSRNLSSRVEAVAPIDARPLRVRLWEMLRTMLNDRRQAWEMDADGRYTQLKPTSPEEEAGTHQTLMDLARCDAAVTPKELRTLA